MQLKVFFDKSSDFILFPLKRSQIMIQLSQLTDTIIESSVDTPVTLSVCPLRTFSNLFSIKFHMITVESSLPVIAFSLFEVTVMLFILELCPKNWNSSVFFNKS